MGQRMEVAVIVRPLSALMVRNALLRVSRTMGRPSFETLAALAPQDGAD
jgi:hypothetical protein